MIRDRVERGFEGVTSPSPPAHMQLQVSSFRATFSRSLCVLAYRIKHDLPPYLRESQTSLGSNYFPFLFNCAHLAAG